MSVASEVDLRCPLGPRKLLAKVKLTGDRPIVNSDNLLEMACQDCRRRLRSEGQLNIRLVLHRFDIIGQLIETEIVRSAISGAEHLSEG
jgi:hypothetical protein